MSFSGHYWTIVPLLKRRAIPPSPPEGEEPWKVEFDDPDSGRVCLTGTLRTAEASKAGESALVILVHGLGGCIDSGYMRTAAQTAADLGLSSLRLNLRGADASSDDFYHAGLSSDLARVLKSPALDRFDRIVFMGFSLGGHLSLRYATETKDPRVKAVAAVCSPLDLERSVAAFDRPSRWIYRRYILTNLVRMSSLLTMPTPIEELRRIRRLRDWDRHTVVRRFGFTSAGDYYRRASVAHRLDQLRRPGLLVAARHDPMVPAESIAAALPGSDLLRVEWAKRGGHIGFPDDLDIGEDGPKGFHGQVLSWLKTQVTRA